MSANDPKQSLAIETLTRAILNKHELNIMLNRAALLLTLFILGSCAVVSDVIQGDCARSFCGCSKDSTLMVEIKLSRGNAEPIPGAYLVCKDPDDGLGIAMGITNSKGMISIRVPGYSSPGCGFTAYCEVAYFRTKERGFERPFWFNHVLFGTYDDTTDRRIEVVIDRD